MHLKINSDDHKGMSESNVWWSPPGTPEIPRGTYSGEHEHTALTKPLEACLAIFACILDQIWTQEKTCGIWVGIALV